MTEIFKNIPEIKYEGKNTKNPLAFRYYDADRVIMGKKMSEHLPFQLFWLHIFIPYFLISSPVFWSMPTMDMRVLPRLSAPKKRT